MAVKWKICWCQTKVLAFFKSVFFWKHYIEFKEIKQENSSRIKICRGWFIRNIFKANLMLFMEDPESKLASAECGKLVFWIDFLQTNKAKWQAPNVAKCLPTKEMWQQLCVSGNCVSENHVSGGPPHCCRLQAVYSTITVKNFVTVYTAFNPCN